MKKIEDITGKYRNEFDDAEPSPDHFNAFEQKLNEQQHQKYKKRRLYRIIQLTVSAAAVMLFLFGLFTGTFKPIKSHHTADKLPAEIQEMENYYTNQIESGLTTLNEELADCPSQRKEAQSAMKELDKSLKDIQDDLKENPTDELVINAMINHYHLTIEVMNQLIQSTKNYCF